MPLGQKVHFQFARAREKILQVQKREKRQIPQIWENVGSQSGFGYCMEDESWTESRSTTHRPNAPAWSNATTLLDHHYHPKLTL
jgi:hypothetical protein